ncbi:MAG TPA: hypothetical protein VM681_09035 [Candidatus Thermoplasmatota archaeon]|nr:hypothetical protein [Candidatus Thermoplasmatota archaeon]
MEGADLCCTQCGVLVARNVGSAAPILQCWSCRFAGLVRATQTHL